jgi:methylase of polypeptide subunit release factors
MCTGSGCIAISVFRTLKDSHKIPLSKMPKFTLVDISEKALQIARKNAESLCSKDELCNFHFIKSNLFENIQYSYDVILTNPPYIPHSMVQKLLKDGRNEPVLALDGDITLFGERAKTEDGKEKDDGLEIIRNLIPQCKSHLNPMGIVLMETGEYNAEETSQIAKKNAESLCSKEELCNFHFIKSNLFENIQYSYDVILSNPPYIPHSMVQKLLQDGRSEPALALDGDITLFGERAKTADGKEKDDGLEIIRNLIPQCKSHLSPMGIVLMETGEYNAEETSQIAKNYGFKTEIFTDLENQLRVVVME